MEKSRVLPDAFHSVSLKLPSSYSTSLNKGAAMHNGSTGSKRKASVLDTDVLANRTASGLVPEDVLRTMASSLNAAMLDLMALPSTDVAARGRVVAVIADCKRHLNNLLGIKRRVRQSCRYTDNEQSKVPPEIK